MTQCSGRLELRASPIVALSPPEVVFALTSEEPPRRVAPPGTPSRVHFLQV